jgi:pyruvate/2-oxoglutarate/acetoin dehydrogenase E1 component
MEDIFVLGADIEELSGVWSVEEDVPNSVKFNRVWDIL